MRVAIDSGPLTGGHSVRGVGISTKGLMDSLLRYNTDKDIIIEKVDFSNTSPLDFDILHYTSFNPYFLNIPRLGSAKGRIILTIHDLIPVIYKNNYSPGIKGELKFQMNKLLVKYADKIITVSETSKKDIIRILGVNEKKIEVIYWAPDETFREILDKSSLSEISSKYRLPNKFILYVGDVNYNKNLSTLIEATTLAGIPLVIVGKQASNIDELTISWSNLNGPMDFIRSLQGKPHPELFHFKKLSSLIKERHVVLTGFVPSEDLIGIYNLASVYVQPSLYEGFGIPVLEAFVCGVPVVISKTQSLVEIANGAALTADPDSAEDFSEKIKSLLNDNSVKLHLIRAGKTRVKDFSWKKTAEATINIYKKII